ncbi:uncharacterized protein LOC123881206 [Maniola jurtina]|uniref:uncharacterized protein LOC123881206 n=1 Tax=Maniola jurtina TaxID=191418 RepID=UPI001E687C57|nr:uncharacterized protein LOC123881206 [Maniola jurtina]
MKTIILLCTWATIATAVPTNHHETLQEQELALEHLPATIQRERKSPLHDHHAAGLSTEAGTEDLHTQSTSKSGPKISPVEGRSLGFKKPIIVKKKIGYHLYRDSDEERAHADPHENCREQVKVKLCDDEPGSPKSKENCVVSERLNEDISGKEIENSIKTAKEAVENLQRGFHKMEHNSAKLTKTEGKETEDDMAVHEHIEAARKALEHVHRNFGHLDTLNLQATSPKTEDFQIKSSDEERLAQWKEAIDNIQKNFEIARNIEDAFKINSEQTNLQSTLMDESSKTRESEHMESNLDSQHKSIPASLSNKELLSDESAALMKQRENSNVDMFTAPTEQKELKVKLHSDSLRSEKITEEPLGDHETKTLNIEKSNENVPAMKDSEIKPMSDGSLKTEGVKSENLQEVVDHVHNHQSKDASNNNLKNENVGTLESNTHDTKLKTEKNAFVETKDMTPLTKESVDDMLNLAKSAHTESFDQTTKHDEHDMPMEASHVSTHQSQVEMKNSVDNESEKSTHKGDSVVTKMSQTDEQPIDQSLKLKSVPEVDEHHKEEQVKSINHNHEVHERMSNGVPTPANTKHTEPTPIRETGFNNGQQNLNDNPMRLFEDQNTQEHKSNEMHKLNEHPNTDMRMTEDQKFHAFLMRWANENQQRVQESPTSLSEDLTMPTKMGEFNNGQHSHDMHPSMRLSQNDNSEHHLSENHEQDPVSTHWAHEKQQTPLQVAKTVTEFHETMKSDQHQTMQNQLSNDHNSFDLDQLLMRLAQEKQQNDHLKTTSDFHNGHLHEIVPQNRFANNLANVHDMSQVGPRMHEHLHIMKHAMVSDMDNSMQPSMQMSMRDSIGKPTMEHNDMHWNHHHHAMARYGSGLPVSSGSTGAIGLFPNANTGSCGIPLMLSCSPNVVSGTLAKAQPHPGTLTPPAYRSGDDLMYYMKRDAKDTDELPALKIQKTTLPFVHKPELIFDKTQ